MAQTMKRIDKNSTANAAVLFFHMDEDNFQAELAHAMKEEWCLGGKACWQKYLCHIR